jgi:hypothetical protein
MDYNNFILVDVSYSCGNNIYLEKPSRHVGYMLW